MSAKEVSRTAETSGRRDGQVRETKAQQHAAPHPMRRTD
jgi:hypothetical protein